MCRVLAYAGHPVLLDDLLYRSSSSLVRQSYAPQQLQMLNLGGFGLMAWDPSSHEPARPYVYRSTQLPMFDPNLRSLTRKIEATCFLAHVRGVPYDTRSAVGRLNLHPFQFEGASWAMAHNGDMRGFARMRADLLGSMKPDIAARIRGNTDSEAVYALVLNELPTLDDDDPKHLAEAIHRALTVLRRLRAKHGVDLWSSLNLFFTNGASIVALRYTFDFGRYPLDDPASLQGGLSHYLSLWFTAGERYTPVGTDFSMQGDREAVGSVVVASEPLSRNVTGWVEVPEYTLLIVSPEDGAHRVSMMEVPEAGVSA